MLSFLLLLLCASARGSYINKAKPILLYDLEKAEEYFEDYIKTFNKNYIGDDEKQMRLKIFKESLDSINKLNSNPGETAVFGTTQFTDFTKEEFSRMNGFRPDNTTSIKYVESIEYEYRDLPDNFDWRTKNVVSPIKNQGNCGSCWAFSTAGNVEGQYAIKHNQLVSVSEQELVDCDTTDSGCDGGFPLKALQSIISLGGIESEDDYPYQATQGTCSFDKSKVKVQLASVNPYDFTSYSDDQVRGLLVQNGPISIIVAASSPSFQHYNGGILADCPSDNLDHAVLLVGYGTDGTTPFWIVKNSYDTVWGEQGYMRVARAGNPCGMMNGNACSSVAA